MTIPERRSTLNYRLLALVAAGALGCGGVVGITPEDIESSAGGARPENASTASSGAESGTRGGAEGAGGRIVSGAAGQSSEAGQSGSGDAGEASAGEGSARESSGDGGSGDGGSGDGGSGDGGSDDGGSGDGGSGDGGSGDAGAGVGGAGVGGAGVGGAGVGGAGVGGSGVGGESSVWGAGGGQMGVGGEGISGDSGSGGTTTPGSVAVGGDASVGGEPPAGAGGQASLDGCTDTLAQGVTLSEIALFQSGKITIMKDGLEVPAISEYGAEIIAGRATLLRASITVDPGYSPRQLSARLTLNDGSLNYTSLHTIGGSSTELSDWNSFLFELPSDVVASGLQYSLSIVECSDGAGANHNPRFPAEGMATISVRSTGRLRLHLIPVSADGVAPQLDEDFVTQISAYLDAMYPTTSVEVDLSSTALDGCNITAATASDGDAWESCLYEMDARRASDEPDADVYYLGIVKPTDSIWGFCPESCIAGISWVVEQPDWEDARSLLSFGYLPWATSTVAHELGHTHGLSHSPGCGADGSDPSAPYVEDGAMYIGWTGWDKRYPTSFIDAADYTDIMTYCNPQWVSDYVYASLTERVATLNAQHRMVGSVTKHTYLVLHVRDGQARFVHPITTPRVPRGVPVTAMGLDSDGYPVEEVTVYRTTMSGPTHGVAYWIPEPLGDYSSIEVEGVRTPL